MKNECTYPTSLNAVTCITQCMIYYVVVNNYLCNASILHVVQKQLDIFQALLHEAGDSLGQVWHNERAVLGQSDLLLWSGECAEKHLAIVCSQINGRLKIYNRIIMFNT